MIAILFAPASVAPHRLQMSGSRWADPNVCPGWRNHKGANSLKFPGISENFAIHSDVNKSFGGLPAQNSGTAVCNVTQARKVCSLGTLGYCGCLAALRNLSGAVHEPRASARGSGFPERPEPWCTAEVPCRAASAEIS